MAKQRFERIPPSGHVGRTVEIGGQIGRTSHIYMHKEIGTASDGAT